MFKRGLSVVAGLLAVAAFALTPATASARGPRGGGGGGWHGGGAAYHGGGTAWRGGGYRGGYYGNRGWGGNRGWYGNRGWGGFGVGLGLGYALGSPWYGYGGGYWPGSYSYSDAYPYYYGDGGAYYDTYPNYAGAATYSYPSAPAYNGDVTSQYDYGNLARSAPAANDAARVRVVVPPDAKVWFDDQMTQQSGQVRLFESPQLQPGREYTYDIKAQWRDQSGKEVTQTRHVDVTANANVTVDFNAPQQ